MSSPRTVETDLVIRPLTRADAPAVLALQNGYERAFFGEPLIDLEDVLSGWSAPSFHVDQDTLGYFDADRLVAAAMIDFRGRIELSTTQELRGGPVETQLLDHFERLALARDVDAVDVFVAAADRAGRRRLAERGYRLHHTSWILRLEADAEIASRALPPGYRIRPFTLEDAERAYRVIADAFSEWQEHQRSYADWRAGTLDRESGDPSRFRVACYRDPGARQPGAESEPGIEGPGQDAEEIVGACIVFDSTDEAWVAQLATRADHRGRGVAQQLLAETYAAGRARGLPCGGLSTDSRTGALDLYQRLGMHVLFTIENWARSLG